MRAYALFLPILCAQAAVCLGANPKISAAEAGTKSITVTFDSLPSGKSAAFNLYTVEPGADCTDDPNRKLGNADASKGGTVTITLANPLPENTRICVIETILPDGPAQPSPILTTNSLEANWGRVRASFVGGVLIANDSSAFSSAHQFYALNVEKWWLLPGCYLHTQVKGKSTNLCTSNDAVLPEQDTLPISNGLLTASNTIVVAIRARKSFNFGKTVALKDAVATLTGPEVIVVEGNTIHLQAGQKIAIAKGTLKTATMTLKQSGIELASGDTLTILKGATEDDAPADSSGSGYPSGLFHWPGVTSYFETRLTAIPVASNSANTTATTTASGSGTAAAARRALPASDATTTTPATDTTSTASSFLTSQQTANVGVGVYFPFLLSRWDYSNTPNALFLAPIGKIGFNTITGATSQSVVLPANGGTGTQSFEQIYNYYGYGMRVGHMGLTNTTDVAPETYSYLDVVLGRYSNLESLICHTGFQSGEKVSGSGCSAAYGQSLGLVNDSRKRLYRVDLEGLLKIPDTVFYVGLNANIGQKSFQAEKLDPKFKAPDDIRFLFGSKFDIASLFTKLGVKLP